MDKTPKITKQKSLSNQVNSEDEEDQQLVAPVGKRRPINPTYKSQIFYDPEEEAKQLRPKVGQQVLNELSYQDIFGRREEEKKQKNLESLTPAGVSTNSGKAVSVAKCLNPKHLPQNQPKKQSEKVIPFNAMWWDKSSAPNNNLNDLTEDFAKKRKMETYTQNNVFDQQPSEALKKAIEQYNGKKEEPSIKKGNEQFNIISHKSDLQIKQANDILQEQLVKQRLIDQQLIKEEEDAKKANRNFSNLFGRPQTAGDNLSNYSQLTNKSSVITNNKAELFLPSNVNIDKFDSKRYNPRSDKENGDLNACERHFKNLKSVLDTHEHKPEFKRGNLINAQNKTEEGDLDYLQERFLKEKIPEKKSFMRAGEEERITLLEIKSMKNNFEKEIFKKFCLTKGYRIIVFEQSAIGRGQIFLKDARKNPDPIESLSSHLKMTGATVSAIKFIKGKEFNSKNFEVIQRIKKNVLPQRPQTGKKHFNPNEQAALVQHNLFSYE